MRTPETTETIAPESPPVLTAKPLQDDLQSLRIERSRKTTRKKKGPKWGRLIVAIAVLGVVAYVAIRVDWRSHFGRSAREVQVAIATRRSPGDGTAASGP